MFFFRNHQFDFFASFSTLYDVVLWILIFKLVKKFRLLLLLLNEYYITNIIIIIIIIINIMSILTGPVNAMLYH